MRAATIAIFSQLLGAAFSLAAPQLAGRVTGLGHRPVADATVVLLPDLAVTRTDSAGCYALTPSGYSAFQLHVSAPHMLAQRQRVAVETGGAAVDVQLAPGDENADGRLDLLDAIALVQRFGPVAANDPLDADGNGALSAQDLEVWYDTCWQAEGHWRSFVLLDDAEHAGPAVVYPPQGRWQTHKDQGSTTLPAPGVAVTPSAGGYLSSRAYQFRYVLGSTVQNPFALIRFLFGQNDQVTFDARAYEGFAVALRGEGQPLIVSLKSAVTSDDWAEYFVRIPEVPREWRVYEFDFRQDFHQPSWGQRESSEDVLRTLQAVQFKADESSRDRALSLWIDNLLFYGRLYEPPTTQVNVRVAEQGQPLPAAVVTIDGLDCRRQALSDLRGEVLFPAVPAGSYRLWAWRPGYATDTLALQVEGQERLDLGSLGARRLIPVPKPLSRGPVRVVNGRLEVDFDGDTVY
ncbi:MAG: hypothetical protein H5U38_13870, partial [Calditrichaeota bacterium]|nr:hypothetical protein [Calditrichota bacterium]MBC7252313.1 hypothetical protein [Anaerolineae bacterium]